MRLTEILLGFVRSVNDLTDSSAICRADRMAVKRYDSSLYHKFTFSWANRVKETFGYSLPKITPGKVLDFGCADGSTTAELSFLYPDSFIIGIDINTYQLEAASYRADDRVSFMYADGYYIDKYFENDSFDIVFAMNNLTDICNMLPKRFLNGILERIVDVIKPDGYLCIASMGNYCVLRLDDDKDASVISRSGRDLQYQIILDILQGKK
ncbi:hypothetical protein COV93_05180 [Candidatus Woesearchaeota archaeon CG11_big_fil_rev_8_21_14_0_20_43_8]|nr:MAG: hypothetical protein COV93_05180 [Candidatus Woesearchaeota archaeon CG11_big_fil_rev_8_21_14_0_20_43_8]PIO09045.1 MAG: hypothetical protein COT47_00110 [Candidatus Woesearchaeota archaeon CG08_land_8_20_14_0_20_43_7]